MSTVRKLWSFFQTKQRLQFLALFVLQMIGAMLELLGVSLLLPFVEALVSPAQLLENKYVGIVSQFIPIESDEMLIIVLLIALIAVFVVKNLYLIVMLYIQYQIVWHNRLKMESDVMTEYLNKSYMYHVQHNSAIVQRIILSDIGAVFEVLSNIFLLVSDLLTSLFLVILLLSTNVVMTAFIVAILGCFLLVYFMVFKRRLYTYGLVAQRNSSDVHMYITQSVRGIKEIKIYQCEQFFSDAFRKSRAMQISMMKRGSFFQQFPRYLLELICTAGVLSVVLLKVLTGTPVSQLVPALTVFAFAAYRILPSANHINSEVAYITNNRPSIDVVYDVLKGDLTEKMAEAAMIRSPEHTSKQEEKEGLKDILLSNLSYQYPTGDHKILDRVNLTIKGGSSIAFKGPSGAGKTTTADVILGILTPTEGNITYGGTDIRELPEQWFSHLGYIPQNIYLADTTIRANVAFGDPNPDDDRVWRALEEAQLKDFVLTCPEGLDMTVGEEGIKLSGGQRQRIGIARALYNDPDILVLDEATSALDNETETAVMDAINHLMGRKTLIIIAHR
nr:ABC transporter ATP-binding protein/permease [Lachnospiraceae bacterium]